MAYFLRGDLRLEFFLDLYSTQTRECLKPTSRAQLNRYRLTDSSFFATLVERMKTIARFASIRVDKDFNFHPFFNKCIKMH